MTSAGMIRVTARDISELMAGNQWQGRAGRIKFFSAEYLDLFQNSGLLKRIRTPDFRF
jgi:hypothetical protein